MPPDPSDVFANELGEMADDTNEEDNGKTPTKAARGGPVTAKGTNGAADARFPLLGFLGTRKKSAGHPKAESNSE